MVGGQGNQLGQFALAGVARLDDLGQGRLLFIESKVTLLFFGAVAIDATRLKNTLDRLSKVHPVLRYDHHSRIGFGSGGGFGLIKLSQFCLQFSQFVLQFVNR